MGWKLHMFGMDSADRGSVWQRDMCTTKLTTFAWTNFIIFRNSDKDPFCIRPMWSVGPVRALSREGFECFDRLCTWSIDRKDQQRMKHGCLFSLKDGLRFVPRLMGLEDAWTANRCDTSAIALSWNARVKPWAGHNQDEFFPALCLMPQLSTCLKN